MRAARNQALVKGTQGARLSINIRWIWKDSWTERSDYVQVRSAEWNVFLSIRLRSLRCFRTNLALFSLNVAGAKHCILSWYLWLSFLYTLPEYLSLLLRFWPIEDLISPAIFALNFRAVFLVTWQWFDKAGKSDYWKLQFMTIILQIFIIILKHLKFSI